MAHRHSTTNQIVKDILEDVHLLDPLQGPHPETPWQDVAGTLRVNLLLLADRIQEIREDRLPIWDLPEIADFTSMPFNTHQEDQR